MPARKAVLSKRRPYAKGADKTETEYLNAAERLFAEQGFEGAKIRAIAEAAGANLGALHYYWGSKEALFKAVCERRLRPIAEQRLRRFDACVAAARGGRPDLRAVLEAAILPVLESASEDSKNSAAFGQLMARTLNDPTPEVRAIMREIFDEASFRYARLLRQACPHLDDETFYWRLMVVIGGAQYAYSGGERIRYLAQGKFDASDIFIGGLEIIDFMQAGLSAPMRQRTPAKAKAAQVGPGRTNSTRKPPQPAKSVRAQRRPAD